MKSLNVKILALVLALAFPAIGTAGERQISKEIDQCSGALTVKNSSGTWVSVPRGQWVTIDVKLSGDNYWFWRCGSSDEQSRSGPHVERLKVYHSTEGREVIWLCFEVD